MNTSVAQWRSDRGMPAASEVSGIHVGSLAVGAILFHARFGLGRVQQRRDTYVLVKFGTRRHKLSYADRVAVWAVPQAAEQAIAVRLAA